MKIGEEMASGGQRVVRESFGWNYDSGFRQS